MRNPKIKTFFTEKQVCTKNINEIEYNTDTIPAYITVIKGEGIGKNGI